MIGKRRRFYFKRIRPRAPLDPLNPATLDQRQLWLRPDLGVERKGRAARLEAALSQHLLATNNSTIQTGPIDFWVAGWIKLNAKDDNYHFASKWRTGQPNEYRIWFFGDDNPLRFSVSSNGSDQTILEATNFGSLPLDTWFFVLAWHDAAGGAIHLRVNDLPAQSTAHSGGVNAGSSDLIFGAKDPGNRQMDGALDQWAFGKSPPGGIATVIDDIHATLYNAGQGAFHSQLSDAQRTDWGLVSWWELEEASGTRADAHGSNDLTDHNGATAVEGLTRHPAVDADPVSHWFDPDSGFEFAQFSADRRPIYHVGPERLEFDGFNDNLQYPQPMLLPLERWTLFLVAEISPNSVGSDRTLFEELGPDELFRVAHVAGGGADSDMLRVTMRPNAAGVERSLTTNAAVAGQGPVVIAVQREETQLRVWLDGAEAGALEIDPGAGSGGSTNRLGGSGGSGAYLDGSLQHVLSVEAALSATEVDQVTAWFESESGL